jgi:hypothetical protein
VSCVCVQGSDGGTCVRECVFVRARTVLANECVERGFETCGIEVWSWSAEIRVCDGGLCDSVGRVIRILGDLVGGVGGAVSSIFVCISDV